MKAVIFNGGKGTRLRGITGGRIPKGYIMFEGKPLIAYQLEVLKRTGHFDSVTVVINNESDITVFRGFQECGLVPKMNVSFVRVDLSSVKPNDHPYSIFRYEGLFSLVGNEDLLCIHSDSVFNSDDITSVIDVTRKNGCSTVTSFAKPRVDKPPFVERDGKLVEVMEEISMEESELTGIVAFSSKDLKLVKKFAPRTLPHIHFYVSSLLTHERCVNLVRLGFYINMNTMLEYEQVEDYISTHSEW